MSWYGQLREKRRGTGRFRWFAYAPVWLVLAGCASQGPLRSPSLHLPAPVSGLAADRVGDGVDLRWTTPTRTTDGLPLAGKHIPLPLEGDICRVDAPRSPCLPLGRVPVLSGRADSFHDVLPAGLAVGPPRLLTYRVRILNGAGKGAAFSTAETLAGTAPPAMQKLEAAPAAVGVLIRWQPVATSAPDRVLLRVKRGSDAPATRSTGPLAQAPAEAVLAVEPGVMDPGGALDPGAKPGVPQQYSAVRTRTVRVGGKDFVVSGAPAVVFVAADAKQPLPAAPTGLEAIASTLGTPEIDLVWQPSASAMGYRVYRSAGAESAVLLTPEPIRTLTYTDQAVKPGIRYRYSISAVASDGRAGRTSNEVTEQISDR